MQYIMPCIYAFASCAAFSIGFNLRGKELILTSVGGALGWMVYLLCNPLGNDIFQFFIATIVISIYSEIMARLRKTPVTGYLLVALLPMVPGGGIYYTMEYCIIGNTDQFLETGLHTLGIAGALAMGILLVSSFVRLWHIITTTEDKA
ncbi:MAG: threonine/serine exporter [Ruminococcaceae bacterium]|nr:threonine/serine exporter [Oscillospiraceae bacterium]